MATKEAGIRLTLKDTGFKSGIRGAESETKRAASSMGNALQSAMSKGAKAGFDAVKSSLSSIKSTITTLGGLVGGIGVADLVRKTVNAQGGFRALSFAMQRGANVAVHWTELQRQASAAALKTGQSSAELGKVMQDVFQETGNAIFAQDSIEAIATAATGAHKPVEMIGAIAGTLNEKFGITSDQLSDTLASVVELGNKGGVSIEELSQRLGVIGAVAKDAGLQGQAGFQQMVAMLNIADNSGKNLRKNIGVVESLLQQLSETTARTKLAATLGIDASKLKGDTNKAIGEILKATGGGKNRDKLVRAVGEKEAGFIVEVGKDFADKFENTKGSITAKTNAAMDAYKAAIEKAGKSTTTWADIQKEAADEMESPEKRLAVAMEKLTQSFQSKEITDAIGKLAESLPKLAEVAGDVIGFASKHPIAAGGLALGGNAALSAAGTGLSSMITSALFGGGTKAAGAIAGGVVAGAETAAAGGGALVAAGTGIAGMFVGGLAAAGLSVALGMAIRSAWNASQKADNEKRMKEVDDAGGEVTNASGNGFLTTRTNAETGQLEAVESKVRRLRSGKGGIAGAFDNYAHSQETLQKEARDFLAPTPEQAAQALAIKTAPKGGGGQRSAEDSKLMAEMMATGMAAKELRVRVVNPSDFSGTSLPKTPPGYTPQ